MSFKVEETFWDYMSRQQTLGFTSLITITGRQNTVSLMFDCCQCHYDLASCLDGCLIFLGLLIKEAIFNKFYTRLNGQFSCYIWPHKPIRQETLHLVREAKVTKSPLLKSMQDQSLSLYRHTHVGSP